MLINKKVFYDLRMGYNFEIKVSKCKDIPYLCFMAVKFKGSAYVMIHYFEHTDPLLQNMNSLSVSIHASKMNIDIDADIKTKEDISAIKRLISEVLR